MGKYKPSVIPLSIRILNLTIATLLIGYGSYGLYINDLTLPDKRGRVLHFFNEPLWIMYVAFICGALVYISEVTDHYDKRNNEDAYRAFSRFSSRMGWICFIGAVVYWICQVR